MCGQIFAFDDALYIHVNDRLLYVDMTDILCFNSARTSVSSRSRTRVTGLWLDRVILRLGRHNLPGIATYYREREGEGGKETGGREQGEVGSILLIALDKPIGVLRVGRVGGA